MSDSRRGGAPPEPVSPSIPVAYSRRPLVLIVEDEHPIAETLGDIVTEAGCGAVLASDGRQGLLLARQERPALVITDYMMPYKNGAQLMLALREEAQSSGQLAPPVVIIIAAGSIVNGVTRADAIIRKPFNIAQIEALLRRFLDPSHGPSKT
jgi:DNA-binding response OmpR family regulator